MDSSSDKFDEDLFDEIIEFDGDDSDDDKENRKHERGRKAKKLQMNKLKSFMAGRIDLTRLYETGIYDFIYIKSS